MKKIKRKIACCYCYYAETPDRRSESPSRDKIDQYYCHRYPSKNKTGERYTYINIVDSDYWCGEFKAKNANTRFVGSLVCKSRKDIQIPKLDFW